MSEAGETDLLHQFDEGGFVVGRLDDAVVLVLAAGLPSVLAHVLAGGANLLKQNWELNPLMSLAKKIM